MVDKALIALGGSAEGSLESSGPESADLGTEALQGGPDVAEARRLLLQAKRLSVVDAVE